MRKRIILLAGPTASGKSKLAIKLAKHLNGEIINADSMQIYKEISILTSKPKPKERKIAINSLLEKINIFLKGCDKYGDNKYCERFKKIKFQYA